MPPVILRETPFEAETEDREVVSTLCPSEPSALQEFVQRESQAVRAVQSFNAMAAQAAALLPSLTDVTLLIKEQAEPPAWSVLIERDSETTVRLLSDPDLGSLSDADITILDEVTRLYRELDQYKLRDMTHDEFAEWQNPGNSSRELPVERILRIGLQKSPEEIERIRKSTEEKTYFENLFGAA